MSKTGKSIPTLTDLFNQHLQRAMASMFCVGVGTIQSFDSSNQTATISLNYKRVVKDYDATSNSIDRKNKTFSHPLLLNCPVTFLTGGQAKLTMPVASGDTCIVFFNDRDIDIWLETGTTDSPPNSERIHSASDAIALVGIRSFANPLQDFNILIASLIDLHGERLNQTGDTKWGLKLDDHSGWVLMCGRTISKSGSGGYYTGEAYRALFDTVKEWAPNTGSEDYDSGDTAIIPDMRGRSPFGADNMGGSQANVLTAAFNPNRNTLGGDIGEESHLLTGRESGIQQHRHTYSTSEDGGGGVAYAEGTGTMTAGANPYTSYAGHSNALDQHQNTPTGKIGNWFVKI